MKRFYLRSFHGGLGDELQFSTLPERLVKAGHAVHLYEGPEVMEFRNNGIRALLYGKNPFITPAPEGETPIWNLGDVPGLPYANLQNDFIKNWETVLGFATEESLPKIYYEPRKIPHIDGLVELSSRTLKYNPDDVEATAQRLISDFARNGWRVNVIVNDYQERVLNVIGDKIRIDGIFDLCDLLYSCNFLITLNSGTHALAAAISRMNPQMQHTSILPKSDAEWILRDKKFIFPKINYIIEGQ